MIKRILGSKIFAFYLVVTVIGFCIGYSYSVLGSEDPDTSSIKVAGEAGQIVEYQSAEEIEEDKETDKSDMAH